MSREAPEQAQRPTNTLCTIACAILASVAIALASHPAFGGIQDYPLEFRVQNAGSHSEIVARNDGPSTISAHVMMSGVNVASDKTWPIDVTLQAHSTQVIAKLWPVALDRPTHFSYRTTHHFGDSQAKHTANGHYRLPFEDGNAFPVGQAYGGRLTTHVDKETQYAFDFAMPEGTMIVAARAGVVVDVTTNHVAGAMDPALLDKANSVTVLHDDGTIAEYAHLAPRAAMVVRGQRVARGDRLAFSGNTGYSAGPHLHFAVSRPAMSEDGSMRQVALPVIFFTHDPPIPLVPQQGQVVSAIYDSPWSEASVTSIHAANHPVRKAADAFDANVAALWQNFVLERTGVPSWGWIVVLLLIWLLVRSRKRSIDLERRFDRQRPRIERID